jgi:hypothetical protein
MEGAGQRRMKAAGCRQSGRLHRYRETDPVRMKEKNCMSAAVNDETVCRNLTVFQGADGRCLFLLTMLTLHSPSSSL